MQVTIPGALADILARTDLTTGPAATDPAAADTRATLDAGRRGRARTLVITPRSTGVLRLISAVAEAVLINRHLHTPAEHRAARTWLTRAGHATTTLAAELAAAQDESRLAAASVAALLAREYPALAAFLADDRAAELAAAQDESRLAAALVTETEATDGTWRGQWIGDTADHLFSLTPDREQGALFT